MTAQYRPSSTHTGPPRTRILARRLLSLVVLILETGRVSERLRMREIDPDHGP
jgi:hypothetical protein